MAAIKSKGNKTTEPGMARQLKSNQIRGWRRHPKGFYGTPGFVFKSAKIAVFVDECFWHGGKRHRVMPQSDQECWNQQQKPSERPSILFLGDWTSLRLAIAGDVVRKAQPGLCKQLGQSGQ